MNINFNERLKQILSETTQSLCQVYRDQLKAVILYGSFARGTNTEDSDIDILILVDASDQQLREYAEKLNDISTDLALKYMKVFSIIDVKYKEYMDWKAVSPFYRNVDKEGIVLYAA